MMNDDRFDDLLHEAAREHNSPPDTPRAEMWAVIAAARGARSAGPAPVTPATVADAQRPVVRVLPFHTRHRRAIGIISGLAATLLIGMLIGRLTATPRGSTPAPIVAQSSTATPSSVPNVEAADAGTSTGPGPVIPPPVGPSVVEPRGTMLASGPADSSRGASRSGAYLRVAEGTGPVRTRLGARESARESALPYRVAAIQHLMTTEALLVSLRSDVRAGRKDTTIAVWADDLLGTTRMLIDSPAGRDPQLKQLLEDLELVLAQISRLPGAQGEAADLGIIDDAVRHREIMTRLRALSPNT
jgi:hypothetical protein